ncbi:MAG: hypothetical protein JWN54_1758 [Mycobacterium sp.]|nr:hypothetical protein [Mycobacterium sp.]
MRLVPLVRRRTAALSAGMLLAGAGVLAPSVPAAHAVQATQATQGSPAPAAARALAVFPSDTLTVRDRSQLTGRRVALPKPDCTALPSKCETVDLIDQLDGFDLDPRIALRFDRAVDPAAVAAATTVVGAGRVTGVDRVVYDPATHTVFAHPVRQLRPGTTYLLWVRPSRGVPHAASTFTTMSATRDLTAMRAQLDSGLAHTLAGIPAPARGLRIEHIAPVAGTTVAYTADRGTELAPGPAPGIPVPGAGSYVFGSYLAPNWLTADRVIPQTPTRGPGPRVRGQARLPFVLVLPAGTPPRGGWPVAVFGHGFTGLVSDVFRAAAATASRGIATVATDAVGHGSGPRSTWTVTTNGVTTTLPAYGRGVDLNGDSQIGPSEGLGTPAGSNAAVNLRDGLRQTTADLMTLIRAVGRGVDVDADGDSEARPTGVTYFGQSLGGIYGTMLGGTDPRLRVLVLNVPGGPITEVARLSPELRLLVAQGLAQNRPSLLNGGTAGFTESMPLRGEPPVTAPAPGALAIQDFLADGTWLNRSGSPEAFAPLLRAKGVLFQHALGDETVPNPTSYTLLAAGDLFGRDSLYRNDLTPQADRNPHAFLFDPRFPAGAPAGQRQLGEFLAGGGRTVVDPDGAGPVWEVPIRDPAVLRRLNF